MSELQDVCDALTAIDGDIIQMAQSLHSKSEAYGRAAANVAAAARSAEGEAAVALARTASALNTAALHCGRAAQSLVSAASEGRAFVQRAVGDGAPISAAPGANVTLGPQDAGIDYGQLPGTPGSPEDSQFTESLERAWTQSYLAATRGEREVVAFSQGSFTWLYDATTSTNGQADNRLIGVYGRSAPNGLPRDKARIGGFPSPQRDFAADVHRGHAAGHQLGGPDEGWNLFPQAAEVNMGPRWRDLEKYCANRPGTFMFVHAVYTNETDVPAALEYGVMGQNGRLVVEYFDNLH